MTMTPNENFIAEESDQTASVLLLADEVKTLQDIVKDVEINSDGIAAIFKFILDSKTQGG